MRPAFALAAAGLVALGSCSVKLDFGGTNFACDATHACPPGYICLGAGFCAGADWRCGKINVLADDFEDGWRRWEWGGAVADNGAALAEEGGQAIATPAAGATDPSAAYYQSTEWYEWTDSRAYVEVPQSVSGAAGARAFFALIFDGDDELSIEQEADQLYFRRRTVGAAITLGSVRYDPAEHRWWQIRAADAQTVWETSPDAFEWTSRFEETRLAPPSLARIRFGAAADAGVVDPGAAHFDNLNGGVSVGHACRAQDLQDDFDGSGTDGWRRSYEEGGATRAEVDGTALVTLSDTEASAAGFVSSSAYRLVDSGLSVQVLEVPEAAAGVSTWLAAVARNGDSLGVRLAQDTLYFEQARDGAVAVLGTVLYDPAEHRFWGIAHRNGEVRFSTSVDGQQWVSQVSGAEPFNLETMTVSFGASATAPPLGTRTARFDTVR